MYSGGEFSEDSRGKYVRYQVIFDEDYRDRALDWVHSNSSVKGKPNMVASDFCEWINSNLLPSVREHHPNIPDSVSVRTVQRWLHNLGFDPCSTKKGVYVTRFAKTVLMGTQTEEHFSPAFDG